MKSLNKVRIGKKGQIVVPKKIRDSLKLHDDSILTIYQDGSKIVLVPTSNIGTATRGILKGTWGKTKQEIDDNLKKERDSWDREFKI